MTDPDVCARCNRALRDEEATACPSCGALHHTACWETHKGCAQCDFAEAEADSPASIAPGHFAKQIDSAQDLTLSGRHLAVHLESILVNVTLRGDYDSEPPREVTLVGAVFENLCDDRAEVVSPYYGDPAARMIDTEGFQHTNGDLGDLQWFNHVTLASGATRRQQFRAPESPLEARAKTRGWVWFDHLPPGVVPERLLFITYWRNEPAPFDRETLEFVLSPSVVGQLGQLARRR